MKLRKTSKNSEAFPYVVRSIVSKYRPQRKSSGSENSETGLKVSVIIPTFNGRETIRSCVNSILNQTLKPFEILIIDNASDDKTRKELVALSFNKSIRYFRNNQNLGVTGGRNKGIKEANKKSDYLLFFDHDMVADKEMLQELVK